MRRGVPPSCPAGTEDLPSPPSEELRLKCEEAERLRGLLSGGHQGATWGRVGHQGEQQTHLEPGLDLAPPLRSTCLSLREPVGCNTPVTLL